MSEVPNAAYSTDQQILAEVAALVATFRPQTTFLNMAETVYEGLCAISGSLYDSTDTGPDLIARLPEHEDGSDPRWKLLEYAPRLAQIALSQADALSAALEREAGLRGALTPDVRTKAAYMGEFFFEIDVLDEDGEPVTRRVDVPWATVKEIMAAITRKALEPQ